MRKLYSIAIPVAALALLASPAAAKSPYISGGDISVKSDVQMQNATLTVSGPNGFYQSSKNRSGTPSLSLMKDGNMADGTYNWQLTGHTSERVTTYKNRINNGRGDDARNFSYKTVTETGSFTIKNGVRVDGTLLEENPIGQKTPGKKTPVFEFDNR